MNRETGRLLDIGCGHGDFLKVAEKEGWEPWGLEPSRGAFEMAQRHLRERIRHQTVEQTDFPSGTFDVITMWNVIDCLPDPSRTIQKIREWLAPGGILVIRTPNVWFHRCLHRLYCGFKPFWNKVGWNKDASVFLRANFGKKSVEKLLKTSGFYGIQVSNGKPTKGDPYQVFSFSRLMTMAKSTVYGMVSCLSFISGGQLLLGTNLMIYASQKRDAIKRKGSGLRFRIILKRVMLHGLALIGYLFLLPLWAKILGRGHQQSVLLYHSIGHNRSSDMSVTPMKFERQLRYLTKYYRVVTLEDAFSSLEQKEGKSRKQVAITFDDGYEDNYWHAFPLLKKCQLPATIFLLTGKKQEVREVQHLSDDPYQPQRLLRWEQVREMSDSGITFGSHGQSHTQMRQLTAETLKQEIYLSKEKIEEEIKQPIRFFSYPYGTLRDFDKRAVGMVQQAGYQGALSAIFGVNGSRSNRFALRRLSIEASDTLFTFRAKLNGALGLLSMAHIPLVRSVIRWVDRAFFRISRKDQKKIAPILLTSVDFPPHTDGVSTISGQMISRIARRRGRP